GPKLHESTSPQVQTLFTGAQGETVLKPGLGAAISLTARKYSMPMLVRLLSTIGQSGPGIDETGLAGEYDFALAWDNEAGPVLSTALHQQLGLQMKAQKVPVSTFVVDAAEKPAAN
ncbi:MAG: TIGR03435 family protein, partial [Acidobacteria bacterium]|nr:TIGR03435 family protein [Acidobacteriota bacterium]